MKKRLERLEKLIVERTGPTWDEYYAAEGRLSDDVVNSLKRYRSESTGIFEAGIDERPQEEQEKDRKLVEEFQKIHGMYIEYTEEEKEAMIEEIIQKLATIRRRRKIYNGQDPYED